MPAPWSITGGSASRRRSARSACRRTGRPMSAISPAERLRAGAHPHAVGGREAARGRQLAARPAGARAAAARQPDVCRTFLLEHARSRPNITCVSAGRSTVRGRRDGRNGPRGGTARPAARRPGARNIWSAATADAASCAVRWRSAKRLRQARRAALRRPHDRHAYARADALSRPPRAPSRLAILGGQSRGARDHHLAVRRPRSS